MIPPPRRHLDAAKKRRTGALCRACRPVPPVDVDHIVKLAIAPHLAFCSVECAGSMQAEPRSKFAGGGAPLWGRFPAGPPAIHFIGAVLTVSHSSPGRVGGRALWLASPGRGTVGGYRREAPNRARLSITGDRLIPVPQLIGMIVFQFRLWSPIVPGALGLGRVRSPMIKNLAGVRENFRPALPMPPLSSARTRARVRAAMHDSSLSGLLGLWGQGCELVRWQMSRSRIILGREDP